MCLLVHSVTSRVPGTDVAGVRENQLSRDSAAQTDGPERERVGLDLERDPVAAAHHGQNGHRVPVVLGTQLHRVNQSVLHNITKCRQISYYCNFVSLLKILTSSVNCEILDFGE